MHERKSTNAYKKLETSSVGTPAYAGVGTGTNPRLERAPVLSAESARESARGQGQMNRWVVLALAASSSFITTLDGSIVNIGLPAIAQTFHVGVSGAIEWVIIGYLVIIAAILLTFGRLADMVGR